MSCPKAVSNLQRFSSRHQYSLSIIILNALFETHFSNTFFFWEENLEGARNIHLQHENLCTMDTMQESYTESSLVLSLRAISAGPSLVLLSSSCAKV